MLLLWAMSFWAGAVALIATGYGATQFKKHGLEPLSLFIVTLMVWGLGWWTPASLVPGLRINLGLLLLVVFAMGLNGALGHSRWWYVTLLLALLGAIIRIYAPVVSHQAEVMPVATIESMGLGVVAAVGIGEAFPGAIVGASAEGLAALIVALHHGATHDLGRHDVAMVMICTLSAWIVGWIFFSIKRRFQRFA